jgi:hypothetical protein
MQMQDGGLKVAATKARNLKEAAAKLALFDYWLARRLSFERVKLRCAEN